MLKNLSKLDVHINDFDGEDVTVDLTELCPNLDTLILTEAFIVMKGLKRTVPSLKTFIFPYSWNELLDESDSYEFFNSNRQLKAFECREFNFEDVALMHRLLPNIETLTLFVEYGQLSVDDVLSLQNFQNLRSLTLGFYWNSSRNNKEKIIDVCGRLNNLLELDLSFFKKKDKKEPVINLSMKLVHLERLVLTGIQLDEHAVLDFVRNASKFKVMHFHECDVYATESLLAQLRDIMGQLSQRRYRSECSLFIGDKLNNNFVDVDVD